MPRRPGTSDESSPTFPIETLRHWYVTVCGGLSTELALDQVGINREALEKNTSLDPSTDRVRVAIVGHVRRPVLMDRFFEVVPLDASHPDALRHSPIGEAVFPEGDDVLRRDQSPRPGQQIILNGMARRLQQLPDSEDFARILQEILRADFGADRGNS